MPTMDLQNFQLENLERTSSGFRVRRALAAQAIATDLRASSVLCAGFSLESQNTGEVCHYLFLQDVPTLHVQMHMVDEEFNLLDTYSCGVMPRSPRITCAQQLGHILINGPSMHAPLYGIACGGVITAVKVASINPDTTAIEIPRGICSAWGDRVVIAQGNLVFVSDPGGEVRTFVAENAIALPFNVLSLFETQSSLVCVTTNGVFALPTDALGQGQLVTPFVSDLSTYGAAGYFSAAVSRSAVSVLTREGVLDLQTGVTRQLRRFGVGCSLGAAPPVADFRLGAIWGDESGYWVSIAGALCRVDAESSRWVLFSLPLSIVGLLRSREGGSIILTESFALYEWGADEHLGAEVLGVAAGRLDSPGDSSLVCRFISTEASCVGAIQSAAIAGQLRSSTTIAPSGTTCLLGTDAWGAPGRYRASPLRSKRHAFAVRTDDLQVEVSASRCLTRVGAPSIEFRGVGAKRP